MSDTPEAEVSAAASASATDAAGAPAGGPAEKKLTAKELRMLEREKKAKEEAAAKAARSAGVFGDAPLIQSAVISGKTWTRISELTPAHAGQTVLLRARLHGVRDTGKLAFMVVRQAISTLQCVVTKATNADLFKWAVKDVPRESVIDITGTVTLPEKRVESVTNGDVELSVASIFIVSKASPVLPFSLEDAARPDSVYETHEATRRAAAAEGKEVPPALPTVSQDLRLDYRWIDLRTPANQAIMRISSGVCTLFREYLLSQGFVEIQTPKILGGASEGGSAVFNLKYFGEDACLAQSPQLYKQMCAACSDLERVFEIGPVFRAENSNTHRHLCEFHGLDLEMAINEHYYEVLDVFSGLFIHIFKGLNERFRPELEAVRRQHPFEDMAWTEPGLRITYSEGIALLRAAGIDIAHGDDLSSAQEKALGAIVKTKYGTDFFMMDAYPLSLRPFYTMPHPTDPTLSNSYDLFMRGEEIVSGAQRIHDPELLVARAAACGIRVETIHSYVESFKHGALPHGGGGIGLERVVKLFLGINEIRKASFFPRDPKRLFP